MELKCYTNKRLIRFRNATRISLSLIVTYNSRADGGGGDGDSGRRPDSGTNIDSTPFFACQTKDPSSSPWSNVFYLLDPRRPITAPRVTRLTMQRTTPLLITSTIYHFSTAFLDVKEPTPAFWKRCSASQWLPPTLCAIHSDI